MPFHSPRLALFLSSFNKTRYCAPQLHSSLSLPSFSTLDSHSATSRDAPSSNLDERHVLDNISTLLPLPPNDCQIPKNLIKQTHQTEQFQPLVGSRSISKILTVRQFGSSIREAAATGEAAFNTSPKHEEDHDVKRRQDGDGDRNQNLPRPSPNRPLRGEKHFSNHNGNISQDNSNLQSRGWNVGTNKSRRLPNTDVDAVSDDSFLSKFKLRPETSQPDHPSAPAAPSPSKPPNVDPPPEAHDIFKKMKETGLIPNAVAMLDGLCKDGLVNDAMKLFGSMREKGTIPEVVTYTAVVDGFCKAHKPDDAKRIFAKMQANGITPNAFTYSILIQGLCKCNRLDDAIDFSLQMLEAGHSLNLVTFVGLVDSLCREKGVGEAHTVVATLRQKGFHVLDKAVREFLDRNAPFSPSVWEAIFGKRSSSKPI